MREGGKRRAYRPRRAFATAGREGPGSSSTSPNDAAKQAYADTSAMLRWIQIPARSRICGRTFPSSPA